MAATPAVIFFRHQTYKKPPAGMSGVKRGSGSKTKALRAA
jgi:hypothetical protein